MRKHNVVVLTQKLVRAKFNMHWGYFSDMEMACFITQHLRVVIGYVSTYYETQRARINTNKITLK